MTIELDKTTIENGTLLFNAFGDTLHRSYFTTAEYAKLYNISVPFAFNVLMQFYRAKVLQYGMIRNKDRSGRTKSWVILDRLNKTPYVEPSYWGTEPCNDYQEATMESMVRNQVRPTITPFNYREEKLVQDNLVVHSF